ncbi:MAG: hypothetical protein MUC33_22355 [Desulfobacterales bacterium]|nr:hypothetical protein [Desulfobacterales bacterium]
MAAMNDMEQIRFFRRRRGPILLLALGLALFFSGCTTIKDTAKGTVRTVGETTRKVGSALTPSASDLKYKIALIGLETPPQKGPSGFNAFFQKSLTAWLRADCRNSLVDEQVGQLLTSPPRLASGQIDGYALAALGRPRGLNFFVVGTLSDARLMDERTGFWLWKDTRYTLRAVMRVEVIDSATGTKAMDEIFSEELVIDELRHEQLQQAGPLPFGEIEPVLTRLLPEAGSRLCDALGRQPWQGFVVGADGGRISISSGSAVGLTVGRTIEVFGSGRPVENKGGLRFLQPGDRVGEARIESVSGDTSEAVLSQPAAVGPGGTVRLK